jgi:hypothetical protein
VNRSTTKWRTATDINSGAPSGIDDAPLVMIRPAAGRPVTTARFD